MNQSFSRGITALLGVAFAGLLIACAAQQKPVETLGAIPQPPDTPAADAVARRAPGPTVVTVDRQVADMCKLSEPRFTFDSTALAPDAANTLDAIASCFETGPAKDERMSLVGHAEPRGGSTYGSSVGQRRAGRVANYLERNGLSAARIVTSSRGAVNAGGADETGSALERRVDILLAN